MRIQRTRTIYLCFLVIFLFINSCQYKDFNESKATALCLWHKGSVRSKPSREAAWLSTLSLGEQVTLRGESAIDSSDKLRLYYHVALEDGTCGWASEFVLLPHAVPAVLLKGSRLYSAPDSTSASLTTINRLDFVAVDKERSEWVHVVTPRMANEGWLPKELVSQEEAEVSVGLAYQLAMKQRDTTTQVMLLKRLKAQQPAGATFIEDLTHKIDSYQ